jgi:hypothetical protein
VVGVGVADAGVLDLDEDVAGAALRPLDGHRGEWLGRGCGAVGVDGERFSAVLCGTGWDGWFWDGGPVTGARV